VSIQGVNKHPCISPREAAQMLGTRLDAVYSLIWAGRLKAEKRDGLWLIDREAVDGRIKERNEKRSLIHSKSPLKKGSQSPACVAHLNVCHSADGEEA
jgi:excisionase family DNA binding protein